MIKKIFYIIILAVLILSGCASNSAAVTTELPTELPTENILSFITEPTEPAPTAAPETEPPTEPENTSPLASTQLNIEPGHHMLSYTNTETGMSMKYWLFVPDNATKNMPLVVYLHGMGQIDKIHDLEHVGPMITMDAIYDNDFPFLLLFPNTPVRSWTSSPVPETLKALIDHVAKAHYVDISKISITGHSMGAVGTWNMLSRYGDYFSAAVPVSCPNDGTLDFNNLAKVPIRAFVGNGGEIERTYGKGMNNIIYNAAKAGGDATLTILYQCDHTTTPVSTYTKEIFDWMLDQ